MHPQIVVTLIVFPSIILNDNEIDVILKKTLEIF